IECSRMYWEKFSDAGMKRVVVTFVLFRASTKAWDAGLLSRSCTYRVTEVDPEEPKIAPNSKMRRMGKIRAKKAPTRERRYCVPNALISARTRFMSRVLLPAF